MKKSIIMTAVLAACAFMLAARSDQPVKDTGVWVLNAGASDSKTDVYQKGDSMMVVHHLGDTAYTVSKFVYKVK